MCLAGDLAQTFPRFHERISIRHVDYPMSCADTLLMARRAIEEA